tara:strand:+ start:71 stop:334 length:264 start_codon:yes stop_codon:yes gene_type:complete
MRVYVYKINDEILAIAAENSAIAWRLAREARPNAIFCLRSVSLSIPALIWNCDVSHNSPLFAIKDGLVSEVEGLRAIDIDESEVSDE